MTYGEYVDAVQAATDDLGYGHFIEEWVQLVSPTRGSEDRAMDLSPEHIEAMASDMSCYFRRLLNRTSGDEAYGKRTEDGHRFLQRMTVLSAFSGVTIQCDQPLTTFEMICLQQGSPSG